MRPRPHLSFCAWKTAWLASESLVSMGPSPYLWLLHANKRLLEQNYKSLEVPGLSCHFVRAKQRNLHQNDKSICVPALVCGFVHAKQQLLRSSPRLWFCACKTATFAPEWQVSMGSSTHLCSFSSCKTVTLRPDLQVCISPTPQLWIWTHITACLAQE